MLERFVGEKLDEFEGDPRVAPYLSDIRMKVMQVMSAFSNGSLPKSHVELGALCAAVSEALDPLYKARAKANGHNEKIEFRRLFAKIDAARNAVAQKIIASQSAVKNWQAVEHGDREKSMSYVRTVVMANLALPTTVPKKNSAEWKVARKKLLTVSHRDLNQWGLRPYLGSHTGYFSSYTDLLVAIFPEYKLLNAMEERERRESFEWTSEKQATKNVRTVVCRKLGIDLVPPEAGSDSWRTCRGKILNVGQKDFFTWKIAGSIRGKKPPFASHIDALIAAFDKDYNIRASLEKKRHVVRHSWKDRDSGIALVRGALIKHLQLPAEVPTEDSSEWGKARAKIFGVTIEMLDQLNMGAAPKRLGFGSHIELVVAALGGDYKINGELREFKSRWGQKRHDREALDAQAGAEEGEVFAAGGGDADALGGEVENL